MASYKVIQDVEAEDKFVGPLTFKQFIFAMTGLFFSWVCFYFVTQEIAWALVIFGPLALFGFFMAFPWSKVQPTDVWVLAKIRFMIKPKKRIWNQAGRQDLVTITAPKKIEKHLTKDFSETEVKSRLKALANTIDSRGWVVKHTTAGEAYGAAADSTDRLVDTSALPQQAPDESYDLPDIMENSKMDGMINENDERRRSQIAEKMDQARRPEPSENFDQPEKIVTSPIENGPKPKNTADRIDEMLINDQLKAKKSAFGAAYSHMSKVSAPVKPAPTKPKPPIQTDDDDQGGTDEQSDFDDQKQTKPKPQIIKNGPVIGSKKSDPKKNTSPVRDETSSNGTSTVTDPLSPDILNLARNNDLNVATIARQAKTDGELNDEEVVISLH